MQLQHAANHLAAQGRNGDSMLMHVTPSEVAGLQALAQHHGGSLTINPHTGLPEANFLDDIGLGEVNKFVPAIAGAGLSFFSGGAIDPMTAAGMVGGLAGLTSGSLSQGIMAGLGAYGGASITGALGALGGASNASAANAAAQAADAGATGPLSGAAFSNAAAAPDVGAGFDAATGSWGAAKDFLKDNKWAIGAAALPALSGAMTPEAGPAALKNKGYIRRYEKNPVTGALEQVEAVPVDEWGDRPAVSFGGVGTPVKYADGGITGTHLVYNPDTKKYDTVDASGAPVGPVTFGGVAKSTPVERDPNDTRSDSQKAYDYLMGVPGAKNPMLFYHQQAAPAVNALEPLDLKTRTGGHYNFNAETGTYDWVPDAAPAATDAGLAALAAGQQSRGGAPQAQMGEPGTASGRLGEMGAVAGNMMSNAGQIALGKIANVFGLGDTANYSPSVESHDTLSAAAKQAESNAAANASNAAQGFGNAGFAGADGVGRSAPGAAHAGMGGSDGVGRGEGGRDSGGDHGAGGPGWAQGGIAALAAGGLGSLGGYSDGGQLLKGPGDGVSDSIPATIGHGQPARLADGEFVVPARIVSELGNGSTEAGAKQLYAMMARIQAGRAKTTGKNKVATNSKAARHLPA